MGLFLIKHVTEELSQGMKTVVVETIEASAVIILAYISHLIVLFSTPKGRFPKDFPKHLSVPRKRGSSSPERAHDITALGNSLGLNGMAPLHFFHLSW